MRWEEFRQKKADIFWTAQEAKERNAMFHEDPQLLHEADIRTLSKWYLYCSRWLDSVGHASQAFMQEALQLAEQHERDCMERVEREQREAGVNPALTTLDKFWLPALSGSPKTLID